MVYYKESRLKVYGQYIKDLSFENPNSPFLPREVPNISVMVSINSARLEGIKNSEDNKGKLFHEITLHIEAKATVNNKNISSDIAFICETKYCGVFLIENFLKLDIEEARRILFIDGPTFLFPFAREVIARVTSSGGFPPLMLDPIDFEAMYKKKTNVKI
ncbi:MAG: protein-export chaperone SecB [Wolbachia endosymbiont of Menacanthus eurysternus]|nr:MAG: protein-export chaperone SecB [Wolbachia endosymbiont of Menacanthus eurysternus]